MPDTVPGLRFDPAGLCGFCAEYAEAAPLGYEALRAEVDPTRNAALRYDCLVPVSGGRDSTYALYYAVRELGRKVLAVTFDNEFATPAARRNLATACERLGVELACEGSRKGYFRKIVQETVRCAPSLKQLSICRGVIPKDGLSL